VRKLFLILLVIFAIFVFINANALFVSAEPETFETGKKALIQQ